MAAAASARAPVVRADADPHALGRAHGGERHGAAGEGSPGVVAHQGEDGVITLVAPADLDDLEFDSLEGELMGDDTSAAAAAGAGAEDGDGEGEEEGGDGDEAASIAGAGAGTTPRLTLLWTQPMIEKAAGLGARNHVYATAKGARGVKGFAYAAGQCVRIMARSFPGVDIRNMTVQWLKLLNTHVPRSPPARGSPSGATEMPSQHF